MTSCDAPLTGLIMVTALLVAPFGLPLLALSWIGWRRAGRWPHLAAAGVALVGLAAWTQSAREHEGDPRWLPLLFVPPLAGSIGVLLLRTRSAKVAALAAGLVPALGGLLFGVALWLGARVAPCGA